MKSSLLIATGLLLLVSCSKEKDTGTNTNGTGTANMISIKNAAFTPSSLQVNINATVTWINEDNMVHTVTATDGSFNSGDIAPGSRFSYKFTKTGTVNYHCTYHSGMNGTIIVVGVR